MSAREVAKIAGLSDSYVNKVESGDLEPSLKNFVLIARALNMSDLEMLVILRSL